MKISLQWPWVCKRATWDIVMDIKGADLFLCALFCGRPIAPSSTILPMILAISLKE